MPSRLLIGLAALAGVAATEPVRLAGMWGAGNALLAIDARGGRLQLGCSLAVFAPVTPDKDGTFSTRAQVEAIQLAPPVGDGPDDDAQPAPSTQAATLTGRLGAGGVDLVFTVEGQAPRALHLAAGQRGTQQRCL